MTDSDQGSGQGAEKPTSITIPETALDRFAKVFEASARRWELIVYPSLFAFIVLAAYGFYLIYNITHDMGDLAKFNQIMSETTTKMTAGVVRMADTVEKMDNRIASMVVSTKNMSERMDNMDGQLTTMVARIDSMSQNTESIAADLTHMSGDLTAIAATMNVLSANVATISAKLDPIIANLVAMSRFMSVMTFSVARMTRDVGSLGQAARPMSFMSSMMGGFMPWGSGFMPW